MPAPTSVDPRSLRFGAAVTAAVRNATTAGARATSST